MNRIGSPGCFLLVSVLALILTGCSSLYSSNPVSDRAVLVPEAIAAQDSAVIRVQPLVQQRNVGDIATIEIRIDNVTDLVAAEIELQFDPNILQAQDANSDKEGVQIQPGDFPAPDFVIFNEIDNGTGVAHYALAQLAPNAPASGSGLLASITVQAVGEGTSQLTFVLAQLATGEGKEIAATTQSGQIIVGQATALPTPTTTFTPTTKPDQATATSTPLPDTPTPEPTSTPVLPTSTPIILPTVTQPLPPTNTPIPPDTNIPPNATIGSCYQVQKGDTLYNLGQKFGINPHHINVVNDLYPPGQVYVYQILFIPEQYGRGPNVYIAQPGDTLINIAERCHLPLSFLASVNNLDENAVVQPGHVLKIPIPPFPPPARFPYPFPKSHPAPIIPKACDYVVQPGDTLYSISRRYGISVDVLARANNLGNPHYIYAGQCLTLSVY